MTLGISTRNKRAVSTARRNDIDLGTTPGIISFYAAPRPAKGATPAGPALATVILSTPCGTVDDAGLHLTSAQPGQASSSGVINWARITDGNGVFVMDGDVRELAASDVAIADFVIDTAQVYTGGFIVLLASTLAEGG